MEEDQEEEFTNEQFLAWLQAYSDDVEEAGRKYKTMNKNGKDLQIKPIDSTIETTNTC